MPSTRTLPFALVAVALAVVLAGTAGAATSAPLSSDSTACAGTTLTFSTDQQLTLREVEDGSTGRLIAQFSPGNGRTITTDDLRGEYVLLDTNGEPVRIEDGEVVGTAGLAAASFTVEGCPVEASFNTSSVTVPATGRATALLSITSPGDDRFYVNATGVAPEVTGDLFNGDYDADGGGAFVDPNRQDQVKVRIPLAAYCAGLQGEQTFRVTGASTGIGTNVTLRVREEPTNYRFGTARTTVPQGEVATIPLVVEGCSDTVRVDLLDGDALNASVTVVDADDDGEVTLTVDTATVANNPGQGFDTGSEDRIARVDIEGARASSALQQGSYALILHADGTLRQSSELRVIADVIGGGFEGDSVTAGDTARLRLRTDADDVLTVQSERIDSRLLARMFDGSVTADGVQFDAPDDGTLDVPFPARFNCLTGEHTFMFTGVASGQTTTDTITVESDNVSQRRFAGDPPTSIAPGAVLPLTLVVDCNDSAVVVIESEDESLSVALRVTDTDGDGLVRVVANPAADSPEAFLSARGADEGTLVRTPAEFDGLPEGLYEVGLYGQRAFDRNRRPSDSLSLQYGEIPTTTTTTASPTETTTDTATTTASPTETTTTTSVADTTTTRTTSPGFGVIVALVALLAAALLGRRRA